MAGICFYREDNETADHCCLSFELEAWRSAAWAGGDIDTLAIISSLPVPTVRFGDRPGLCQYTNFGQFLDDHGRRSIAFLRCAGDSEPAPVPERRFDDDLDWYVFGAGVRWQRQGDIVITLPRADESPLAMAHQAAALMLCRCWMAHGRTA